MAEGLIVRPGDKLIVGMHPAWIEQVFVERIQNSMPGIEVVILPGVQGMAVYRPGQNLTETTIDLKNVSGYRVIRGPYTGTIFGPEDVVVRMNFFPDADKATD